MAREMKDSGSTWFGQIPADIKISRVGLHYEIILGKMLCTNQIDTTYTYEPYFCAADIHFEGIAENERKRMWFSPLEKQQYLVRKDDLLVVEGGAGSGGCTVAAIQEVPTYIQNSIMIVRPRKSADVRYLKYLIEYLVKQGYIDVACNKATIPHFTKDKLAHVPFLVFSLQEQKKIAQYLEKKYAELDYVLEKTRASIEEYKKLKQAVITQAVTKGIRDNREMKDSGIEWIGEIPVEWKISQVKYSLKWKSEKGQPQGRVLSLYRDYGIIPKDSRDDNHNVTSLDTSGYKVVDIGDFVINKMKAWQGSMAVSGYRGIISPAYHVCKFTNDKLNKKYFHYLMRNKSYIPEYTRLSTGMRVGQWDLGFDDFKNLPFLLPSQEEQQEIVNYLDEKCSAIDDLITKKEQYLAEIENYIKSLIYEYVTGKKEVPQEYRA